MGVVDVALHLTRLVHELRDHVLLPTLGVVQPGRVAIQDETSVGCSLEVVRLHRLAVQQQAHVARREASLDDQRLDANTGVVFRRVGRVKPVVGVNRSIDDPTRRVVPVPSRAVRVLYRARPIRIAGEIRR